MGHFRAMLDHFGPFGVIFGPLLGYFGSFLAIFGPFRGIFGQICGKFKFFCGPVGVVGLAFRMYDEYVLNHTLPDSPLKVSTNQLNRTWASPGFELFLRMGEVDRIMQCFACILYFTCILDFAFQPVFCTSGHSLHLMELLEATDTFMIAVTRTTK